MKRPSATVTADSMGRPVVVIDDSNWELLDRVKSDGWTEIPGMADGYSRPIPADSDAGIVLTSIALAVATSAESSDRDQRIAEHGTVYAFITSPSRGGA